MKKRFIVYTAAALLLSACSFDYPEAENCILGPVTETIQPAGTFFAGYWPDGKLNLVKNADDWELFWAEAKDVKTTAATPWPQDHISGLKSSNVVFGKDISSIKDFNENGSWFIGVFPLDDHGKYAGFFHAESHWSDDGVAHKSIGVTYSNDYGKTWEQGEPIIVDSQPKGSTPGWSGLGDGCVIRDEKNNRWICYYQGKTDFNGNCICMAMSEDPQGRSGTWKKWNGSSFTIDAYDSTTKTGGKNYPISTLAGKGGANPSVMWNTFLNQWVMVYHGWDPKVVYISYSRDAINWTRPAKLLGDKSNPIWYPNLISSEGDKTGGQDVRLYFSYQQQENGKRKLAWCTLHFTGK